MQLGLFESGPFGATYAHALGIRPHANRTNPILALIGSPTELTRLQSDRLEGQSGVDLITIEDPASDVNQLLSRLQASAKAGNAVVGIRTTSRDGSTPDPLHASQMLALIIDLAVECADSMQFDGIYASGGDVAFAVLDALGARRYEVETEVVPLAVSGKLVGGPHDGLGFATKGGLVGDVDAAVECINQLRSRIRHSKPQIV